MSCFCVVLTLHFEIKRQIWKWIVICIHAVLATALNSLTLTWWMAATPCLCIFSCWDRNNARPSLLFPYLRPDFTGDDSTGGKQPGIFSDCFISMTAILSSPSGYITNKDYLRRNVKDIEFFSCERFWALHTITCQMKPEKNDSHKIFTHQHKYQKHSAEKKQVFTCPPWWPGSRSRSALRSCVTPGLTRRFLKVWAQLQRQEQLEARELYRPEICTQEDEALQKGSELCVKYCVVVAEHYGATVKFDLWPFGYKMTRRPRLQRARLIHDCGERT